MKGGFPPKIQFGSRKASTRRRTDANSAPTNGPILELDTLQPTSGPNSTRSSTAGSNVGAPLHRAVPLGISSGTTTGGPPSQPPGGPVWRGTNVAMPCHDGCHVYCGHATLTMPGTLLCQVTPL
eukprot:3280045-Rhodomonas_salina.1